MIPKILHFCFGMKRDFGGMPFSVVHHIAVVSAIDIIKPDLIYLHHIYEPTGEWWIKTRDLVKLYEVDPINCVNGKRLHHFAHMCDIVRLNALLRYGGIYLDMDTICVKSFDSLLNNKFVISQEGQVGLCNAVMLAESGSIFVSEWLRGYNKETSLTDGFKENEWGDMSVRYPLKLSNVLPDELSIIPQDAFHTPLWDKPQLLFEDPNYVNPNAYCHHLWEHVSWYQYLSKITIDSIRNGNSLYARLAKKYI